MDAARCPLAIDHDHWANLSADARSALVRAAIYHTLAGAFVYPDAFVTNEVRRAAAGITERTGDLLTHRATIESLRRLEQFNGSTVQQLNVEFDAIFGHTISADCPPYETQYGAGIIFAQTQRMGDITAFYRAFGVQLSPDAHERHDHIAAELEFMSVMAFREATAIIENDLEHLAAVRDAERKFLAEHLAPWALSFAERLGRKARTVAAADGGFYAALATPIEAMLRDELQLFQLTPESIGHIEPAKIEFEPEGCSFTCGAVGEPVLANLPGFNV
jgi:TorA maturation chaperone TorD